MDTRKYINERLAELDLELEADGSCLIEIDEDYECVIVAPEDAETVLFCVNVAPVVEFRREGVHERMLIMNFLDDATSGATLGVTPDGEVVAVRLTLSAQDIGSGDIERIVANLADLAQRLRQNLREWCGASDDDERSETALHAPPSDEPSAGPTEYA